MANLDSTRNPLGMYIGMRNAYIWLISIQEAQDLALQKHEEVEVANRRTARFQPQGNASRELNRNLVQLSI